MCPLPLRCRFSFRFFLLVFFKQKSVSVYNCCFALVVGGGGFHDTWDLGSQNSEEILPSLRISNASERVYPGGFGIFFGCSTPSKKRCFGTQEFTRFLSTVSSQRQST